MRIIASIEKRDGVRFVSHLDFQRMLHRAVRRARLPIAYSQGFNPHALISFATALSVGLTSENEWIDIKLAEDMSTDDFIAMMNPVLPDGFFVNRACSVKDSYPSVTTFMRSAEYIVTCKALSDCVVVSEAIDNLLSGEIIIKKCKKSNGKKVKNAEVDIRPMILSMSAKPENGAITIYISGKLDAFGGLNVDKLMPMLDEKLGSKHTWHIHRKAVVLDKSSDLEW